MEGQCTEVTSSKAASVADKRKLHLAYSRHSACLLVAWVISPHIRECIDLIHLLLRQWLLRWILHHKRRVVIWLYEPLCAERISIAVLYVKAPCKLPLVLFYNIIVGSSIASYMISLSFVLNTVPSINVISFTSIPLASASAISMMLLSPMPYEMRSAPNLKESSA